MRRVLIVSREAPPAVGPHSIRVAKLVKYLPATGWEPTLLTTPIDHAWAVDDSLVADLGPATVIRVPRIFSRVVPPTSERSFEARSGPGRAAVERRASARRGIRAGLARTLIPDRDVLWALAVLRHGGVNPDRYDAILTTAPPFSTHLVGALMARRPMPWVAEYRDNWTTNPLYQRGFPRGVLERRLERNLLRRAAVVIAMSTPAADELTRAMNLPAARVHVAPNGFDPADVPAGGGRPSQFEIVYLGSLDERRDPRWLIEALVRRSQSDPDFARDLGLRLVGNVAASVADMARSRLGTDRVRVDGLLPLREALAIGARAAVLLGITTLAEAGNAGLTSKVFEYLGLRRPILMLAPDCPARTLVESLGAGETAYPDDVASIGDAIDRLYLAWRSGAERMVAPGLLAGQTRLRTAELVAAALDAAVGMSG
jgi:glycosyltransferase involved in cell wall biosynthesis